MIQKKICMVGMHGTGKTCMVQRYVQSIFSERYLSTVGVKIDRKPVEIEGEQVTLLLWDLEGRDGHRDISPSYLRGAHGLIYVVDGTRRDTCQQLGEIEVVAREALGEVPSVVAFNKADLTAEWKLSPADEKSAGGPAAHRLRTSAKTGEGVEAAFTWLARATLGGGSR